MRALEGFPRKSAQRQSVGKEFTPAWGKDTMSLRTEEYASVSKWVV